MKYYSSIIFLFFYIFIIYLVLFKYNFNIENFNQNSFKTRKVSCVDNLGREVDEALCSQHTIKPLSKELCTPDILTTTTTTLVPTTTTTLVPTTTTTTLAPTTTTTLAPTTTTFAPTTTTFAPTTTTFAPTTTTTFAPTTTTTFAPTTTTLAPTTTTTFAPTTTTFAPTTTTTLAPTTTTTLAPTTTQPSLNINWVSSKKINNNYTMYVLKGILGKISGGWDEQVIKNINGADTFFQNVKKGDELYLVRWSVYNPQNQSLSISPPCNNYYLNEATQVCYYGGWSYASPNMFKRYGNGGLIMTTQYNTPPKLPIVEPIFNQNGKVNGLKLKDTSSVWAMGNIPARLGYRKIDSTSSVVPDMPDYSIQPKNYTGGLYIALVKKIPNYSGLAYGNTPRIYGNKIQEGKDYVILPLPTPSQFGKSLSMPSSCQLAKNTQSKSNVSVDSNGSLSGCWVYPATKHPTPGNSMWVTNMGDGKEYPINLPEFDPNGVKQGSGATVIVGPVSLLDSNYPSYVAIKKGGTGYCVDKNNNLISIRQSPPFNQPGSGSHLKIEPTTANSAYCNALKAKEKKKYEESEANDNFFKTKCLPYGLNGVYYFKNGSYNCSSGSSNVQCDKQPIDVPLPPKYEDQYWQPLNENTKNKTMADYANFYQNDLDKCIDSYKSVSSNLRNYPSFNNKSSFKPPVKKNVKCPVTAADSPIGPCRFQQSYFDLVASPPFNPYDVQEYACVSTQVLGNNPQKLCYNLKPGVNQGTKIDPSGNTFKAFDFTKAGGPPCTCPCPSGYQSYCGSNALWGDQNRTIPNYVPPLNDDDYWWGNDFYIQNGQVIFKCMCGKTPSQDQGKMNTLNVYLGTQGPMDSFTRSIWYNRNKTNNTWNVTEYLNLLSWAGIDANTGKNNSNSIQQRIAIISLSSFAGLVNPNSWSVYEIIEQYLPIQTFMNDYLYWGAYSFGNKFPESANPPSKAAIEKILEHYNLPKSRFFGSNQKGLQYMNNPSNFNIAWSNPMYSAAQ
jgi:hypothetical protein